MKKTQYVIKFLSVMFLSLVIFGCGGGGGGSSSGGDTVTPTPTNTKLTISGAVIDNDTQEPLSSAKVTVEGSSVESSSDENGNFSLEVETSETSILVNTSAPGFSTSQKVIEIDENNTSSAPFTNIALKSADLFDSVILSSIASTGKKSAKKSGKKFSEGIEVPLTKVTVKVQSESDLIPGNSSTSESETSIDFLAIVEVGLINPNTNLPLKSVPTDFTYDLSFEFELEDEDLDLAGLPLWYYDKTIGKWTLLSDAELVSSGETDGQATVVYKITKIGWFALGKKINGLACVKGRVLDQAGNPVGGALVSVSGISFNGQSYGNTNQKGIFEVKTKPGSTVKVSANVAGYNTDSQTITLQNYNHNQGGAANGTYCQPSGPADKTDTFYTNFPDFLNLVPPTGFTSDLGSDDTPLTLTLQFHKITGTITYVTSDGSKPLPKTDKDNKPVYLNVNSYGVFPLTSDGEVVFALPLKESTLLSTSIVYKEDGKSYVGKAEFTADTSTDETTFSMTLESTNLISISGVVTLNGTPASNASVVLSTGQSTITNLTGSYKFEVPLSLVPAGTEISAVYKQLNTGDIYFSNTSTTTTETTQTINLAIKTHSAEIAGLVVDQSGNPIENAKVTVLVDDKPFGINALTNSIGAYDVIVPVRPSTVTTIKIIASLELPNLGNFVSGFTSLQISTDADDESQISQYSAEKIVLDLSSKDTKVKGKIQLNGVFQPKILVVFDNTKTLTGLNGEFEVNINPGQNTLSVFAGNEPVSLDEGSGNSYDFTATQGETTDLGTLTGSTKRPLLYFVTNQFQKTDSIDDTTPIKVANMAAKSFVYLQLKAKGTKETPKIALDDATIVLISETTNDTEFTNTAIFQIPISKAGIFTYKFSASGSESETVYGSNTLSVVSENQAPIITGFKQEKTEIESTNTTGIAFAVAAMDPEGSSLSYLWKVESPVDGTVEIVNATLSSMILKTNKTSSTEISISITVSDGDKSTAKKVLLPVITSLPKLLSFKISPESIASVKEPVSISLETDDSQGAPSVTINWGDGTADENLKKSKVFGSTHTYETEGTYSIVAILIGLNQAKSVFRKTLIVSNSYKSPVLSQGTLSTTEDTAAKLSLSTLIQNPDSTKKYTFSLVKLPSLGRAIIEGDVLTYTPNKDVSGFDFLVIKLFDGVSFSNEVDIKISIKPINDAPVLSNSSFNGTPNITIEIDLQKLVFDPDVGDIHTFKVTTEPTLGTETITGTILSYLPLKAGDDFIDVIANDGTANSNSARISIKINELIKDITLNGGSVETQQNKELVVDLTPYLVNPNNLKPITFVVSQQGKLGDAVISGNNLFYIPFKDVTGDDRITIIAKTDSGQSTEPALFAIKISPVEAPPLLRNASFSVKEGNSLVVELSKLIDNFDLNKTYTFDFLSTGNPVKGTATIVGTQLTYIPNKGESGLDSITVFAISNKLQSNNSLLSISIEKLIQLPVITSTPVISVNEGSPYLYKIDAFHPGNLPLTYVLKTGPAWMRLDTNILSGNPMQADIGLHTVSISVQDGTNSVAQDFTVEVINVNFAPFFTSVPPTTAISTFNYTYPVVGGDADGDALTFTLVDGPKGMVLDIKTNTLTWVPLPTDPLENLVVVQVSDGKLSTTQKFSINLTISSPSIISFVADDPDDRDGVFGADDILIIDFDQATNTPPVTKMVSIIELLKFNDSIGDDFTGEWVTKSRLVITILNPGTAKPGIGTLRVGVNKAGNLLNEALTSNPSTSVSNILKGDWGKN